MSADISPSALNLYPLLARLWLHEPDADGAAEAARALGLPAADPGELARAYADVLLLGVYPYGTAFTDPSGELNMPAAQWAAGQYALQGYAPDELRQAGAPDHLGLCLGFMAHLAARERRAQLAEFSARVLAWAPVCCLAVEREPGAHAFYRSLAARTRHTLLAGARPPENAALPAVEAPAVLEGEPDEDETRLWDVVRFLLTPALCGTFLSRARLGRLAGQLGARLPFGSRMDVARALFMAAGEGDQVERLFDALRAELDAWAEAYRGWAADYPAWRAPGEVWLARCAAGVRRLDELKAQAAENHA